MQIRGLRHIALGTMLCLGVVGCSHKGKHHHGVDGSDASTHGAGEGSGFRGSEEQRRELLSTRVIYFDFDRSDIRDSDFELIQVHADYMKDHPESHVRIEGHADEQGSREYNVALGERRARAVANALVSQGVSGNQLSTVSYGKEKPAAEGHNEESYRLNRRAVIVYEDR